MDKIILRLLILLVVLDETSAKYNPNTDCIDYEVPFYDHKNITDFLASYEIFGRKTLIENNAEKLKKIFQDILINEQGFDLPKFWKLFNHHVNPKFFPQLVPQTIKCSLNIPAFPLCYAIVLVDVCKLDVFLGKDA